MTSGPDSLKRLAAALSQQYAIEAEIGAGGMATVYRAQDLKHNRNVAVKVLNPELAQSLGAARFLREIEIAAGLTHPHVLPLFDSGEAEGLLYFVMPYVKGESLRNRLDREGQFPVEDAVRITREVASALAYAHEEGIVHRDVKPSNILLESGHAVLADFGVAQAVATAKDEHLTRTGTSIGTPAYMSPEQAAGQTSLDGRSDQYALGCVLYEMLTGQPPFTGAQLESVIRQHLVVPPTPVTHARPSVPPEIERVLERALAKNPADRFRTMRDFASALTQTKPASQARQSRITWSFRSPSVLVPALLFVTFGGWLLLSRPGGNRDAVAVPGRSGPEKPSLALFLCDNHSPNPDDAYLADGIHQEFLSKLEKISGISSMGRTTVETYRDDPRPLPAKAAELGVDYVGECSVTKAPDSQEIRITVRLLDAGGESVWGDTYDQDLSAASYFEMLSDVARQLADGLGAFLTPREEGLLALRPTEVDEAWDLYLRGRDYYTRPGFRDENFQIAEGFWTRAVELDPEFALARAKLSYLHGRTAFLGYDRSPERIAAQRREAQEAVRLQPDLPEARFAQGYVAYVNGDLEGALDAFRIAREGAPNDAVTAAFTGYAYRRLGAWDEWEETWGQTLQLNPRNVDMHYNLGGLTLEALGRFPDAIEAYSRALELAPDLHEAAIGRALAHAYLAGELDSLRAVVERLPPDLAREQELELALRERRMDRVLELTGTGDDIAVGQMTVSSRHLVRGLAFQAVGQDSLAREAFLRARQVLERYSADHPEDHRVHFGLGWADAGLGLDEEAVRSVDRYRAEAPYPRNDVYFQGLMLTEAARVMAQAGRGDLAVGLLRRRQTRGLTPAELHLDPAWDRIREAPVFREYLEEMRAQESKRDPG